MHPLRRVVSFLLVVLALVTVFQRRLIYPAGRAKELPVSAFPWLSENFARAADVSLQTADGVTIRGWHLQSRPAPSSHLLILFHGNGAHRAWRGQWYTVGKSLNADILAIDYHGYGDSDGAPTEEHLRHDARAAWQFARTELKFAADQIVLVGESLGGAVATRLAAEVCAAGEQPAALVLVSTFDSMISAASYHVPWLPVRRLLLDEFRSDEAIPRVTCRILQFHGDSDAVVPLRLGRALHDVAPNADSSGYPKTLHVLSGVGHNNDVLFRYGRFVRDEIAKCMSVE